MSSSSMKKMTKAKSSGSVNKNKILFNSNAQSTLTREKKEGKLSGKVNINVDVDGDSNSSGNKKILKFQKDRSLTTFPGNDKSETSRGSKKKRRGSGSNNKKRRNRNSDNDRPFKTSRTHEEDDAEKKRGNEDGNRDERSSRKRNETDSERVRRRARRKEKGGGSSRRRKETDSEKEKRRTRKAEKSSNTMEGKDKNSTKDNVDSSPKRTHSKRSNIKSSKSRRPKKEKTSTDQNSAEKSGRKKENDSSDSNKKSSKADNLKFKTSRSSRKDNDSSDSSKKSSRERKSHSKSSARSGKQNEPILKIATDQESIFDRKSSRKSGRLSGDERLSIDKSTRRKSDDHRLSIGKRSARLSIDKKSSRRKSDYRLSTGRRSSRRSSDDKRESSDRKSARRKSDRKSARRKSARRKSDDKRESSDRKSARRKSDRKSARRKSGRKSGEDSSSDKKPKERKSSLPEETVVNASIDVNSNVTPEEKISGTSSKSIKKSSKYTEKNSGRKVNDDSSSDSAKKFGKKSSKHTKKLSKTDGTTDAISKKHSRENIGFQTSPFDASGKRRRQSDIIIQSPSLKERKRTSVGANSRENSPLHNSRTVRVGSGVFVTEETEDSGGSNLKMKKHSNSYDTKRSKGKPSKENRESIPNLISSKRERGHKKKTSIGSVNEFQKGDYLLKRKGRKSGSKREKVSSDDIKKSLRKHNRRARSNSGSLKNRLNRRSVNLSTSKLKIKKSSDLDLDVNIEKRFKTSREHRQHREHDEKENDHKYLKPGKRGPSPRSADTLNMRTQSSEQVTPGFSPVIQSTVIESNTGITVDPDIDLPRVKRERLIDHDLWTTSQQHTPSKRRRMTEHDIMAFPISAVHSFVGSQQTLTLFDILTMRDEKKKKLRKSNSSTELGASSLKKRRFLRRTVSHVDLSEMTKGEIVKKSQTQNKSRAKALGFRAPNRPPPPIPTQQNDDNYNRPEDEGLASFLEHPVHFNPVKEYTLEEDGIVYDIVEIYGEIDSKIISRGTPDSIITQLAGMEQIHLKDLDFISSILSTYPYFISSEELLDAIIFRFAHEPPNPEDEEMVKLYRRWRFTVRKTIRLVIEIWLSDHIHYFSQDINLLDKLSLFINEEMGTVRPEWPGELMTIMNTKLEEINRSNELYTMLLRYMDPKVEILEELPVKSSRKKSKIPFLKYSAEKIAYQLTIIENTLYSAINPDELLRAKWKKPNKKDLAPNICNCIQWFNDLTTWVQYVILSQSEIKYRAQVLSHFISIVNECLALKNFNSIWAIISAMNQTPVNRLTYTWAILTTREKTMFETCTDIMSSEHNFTTYRDLNTYIMERAKQREDSTEPISTPYLGLVCQDLLLVDELPTRIDNKINIKKLRRIAGTIGDFRKQIKGTFHTPVDMNFIIWLLTSRHESTTCDLYDLSYICEPRGAKK